MDDFYALATADYRHLAEAIDWRAYFEGLQRSAGARPLRLLDVACGSGKFPRALLTHGGLAEAALQPLAYSLLDPSAFSIAEARAALAPPFHADATFQTTIQDFAAPPGSFDLVIATHALYAVPSAELEAAMARFLDAAGHAGFIAHADAASHYIRFHRHFLADFGDGEAEPYTDAEAIIATIRTLGASVSARTITYENRAPAEARATVEGFLQRCVFDDTVSLDAMEEGRHTGPYLAACRDGAGWRFEQTVSLIFVDR